MWMQSLQILRSRIFVHIYAHACLLFFSGIFLVLDLSLPDPPISCFYRFYFSISVCRAAWRHHVGWDGDNKRTAAPPLFQEQKNHLYYCIVSLDLSGDGGCRHSRAESGCVNTQQTDSPFQPVVVWGFVRLKRQKSHTGAPLSGDPVSRPRLAAGRRSTPHQSHTQQPVACVNCGYTLSTHTHTHTKVTTSKHWENCSTCV